jgi:sugar O-acyltransferase (sialic acid O-acetyltransferase NeuD family)
MGNIILIGYSGHAYVAVDIALKNKFSIKGYIDLSEKDLNPFDLMFLGTEDDALSQYTIKDFSLFVGIGESTLRCKIMERYQAYKFISLIHPSSIINSLVTIDDGTMISGNVVINTLSRIGKGCIINTGAIIEHECIVDDFTHIGPGAVLAGNVKVGKRSFVGANAVVKQGITIGNDVTVGAGGVVLYDVPNGATVIGNPGKIVKV